MLTMHLIERHFRTGRFESLLEALSANGMELPLPLRVRLAAHPSAALGLALRRVVELSYGPTPLSRELAASLLESAEADGSFNHDPLATACVATGLEAVLREQPGIGLAEVGPACERALAALAGMQNDDGLFDFADDRTRQDRELIGAFILSLLGGLAQFRAAAGAGYVVLLDRLEAHGLDPAAAQFRDVARVESGLTPRRRRHVAIAA